MVDYIPDGDLADMLAEDADDGFEDDHDEEADHASYEAADDEQA